MTNIKDWPLAVSLCYKHSIEPDVLAEIKAGGVEYVEISSIPDPFLEDFVRRPKFYADRITDAGLKVWSLHLPFGIGIDIASLSHSVLTQTREYFHALIKAASEAGAKVVVVHPGLEPVLDCDREARLQISRESLTILSEYADSLGLTLAVEDLPRSCLCNTVEEMARVVDGIDKLRICFDTNHMLNHDNVKFVETLGDRIVTLHVSDYDFVDERHQLPLVGDNDWAGIIHGLEKKDYHGVWLYETSTPSLEFRGKVNHFTAKDLYENKKTLEKL